MATTSTWGDPTATKRVLLIHGITGQSLSWHRVAQDFASRGYLVTAPDLLGHGRARRGSNYTVAALAEELKPFFVVSARNGHSYDIVVGHTLGGVVAAALLPLLKSTRPVRVVLVDPPLELTPEFVAHRRKFLGDILRSPRPPEDLLQEHPLWTNEDAVFGFASLRVCDVAAVEAIFDQNTPWSFAYMLQAIPENVKLTVLAADPSKMAYMREEDLKAYPHVTTKTVLGASRLILHEYPQVVVDAALENATSSN